MTQARQTRKPRQVYAFIDTNIFLDFYRQSNDATLKLLERLKPVREKIICSYQVEMEFLKNRQSVLLSALKEMKSPEPSSPPAIFADSATNKSLKAATTSAKNKADLIRSRVIKLLQNPKQFDPVYQVLEDVFHSQSNHVLTRDMEIRQSIKRKAWKRFVLGYPPRKSTDTSIGDALNWEWIIHCAKQLQGKIVVVSRDSDYGVAVKDKYFLNDQLRQEFRDRVGQKSIVYTQRLSEALRHLHVNVTDEEVAAESESMRKTKRVKHASFNLNTFFRAIETSRSAVKSDLE